MSGCEASPQRSPRHAGGAAAAGGLNFQAAVTAIAIIYMLRGQPIRWLENVVHDLVIGVEAETGTSGDDIRLTLAEGGVVEVQVKKGLRATQDLWSALLAIAVAIERGTGVYGLLVVCPQSSQTIQRDLQRDLINIGEGRTDHLTSVGRKWLQQLQAAGLNPTLVCARLRIRTVAALTADRGDVQAARAELSHICEKSDVDHSWTTLYANAAQLIERRGRHDRSSAATILRTIPVRLLGELAPLDTPPPRPNSDTLSGLLAGQASPRAAWGTPLSDRARTLLGKEAEDEAERIRKSRYFVGFDLPNAARRLVSQLSDGEFSSCADPIRARLLAYCARWLAFKSDAAEVEALIAASRVLGPTEEATIASAFVAAKTDWTAGLQLLAPIATPSARSAMLQIVYNANGPEKTLAWIEQAGLGVEGLNSDGRFVLLSCRIHQADWDGAFADARKITDQDFECTPILCQTAAVAFLAETVVVDMRPFVLSGVPLDPASFPLIDAVSAINLRRDAKRLFREGEIFAREFGSPPVVRFNAQYALWLELRDPATHRDAKGRLVEIFAKGNDVIPYVPLALAFEIPLDRTAIDATLARQMAFEPAGNAEIAVARLALAMAMPESNAAVAYFDAHAEVMRKHLVPAGILKIEINFLVAAKRFARARERLAADGAVLGDADRQELEQTLARGPGGLETHDLEQAYARSSDTSSLKLLVMHLAGQDFSDRLVELGRELVLRTRSRHEAEALVSLLVRHSRHYDIAALLDDIHDLVDGSPLLRSALAWNFFRDGDLGPAERIVDALLSERDDQSDRNLKSNILIFSGRWSELTSFVESQWAARHNRDPEELIAAAQLGHWIGSPRAMDLIKFAAKEGAEDPHVLLGSYSLATQMGRENDPETFSWFEQAATLSGEDGPVQRISLADLFARAPDRNQHVEMASELWRRGEAALPLVAKAFRQASLAMLLAPIIANPTQSDPRKRTIVSAFSGARDARPPIANGRIGLDGSALITLASLGRLGAVLSHPRGVILPHATLSWMFAERRDLPFHQPSRIAAARDLIRLITDGKLHLFSPREPLDASLSDLVGRTLAAMLVEAQPSGNAPPARYVIRSAKVTRVGSFLNEVADLSTHAASLRSCQALVDALVLHGVMSGPEEAAARRYLERAEERWPVESPLAPGADLYLDDPSVSYLQWTGVLGKISAAGFRPFISENELVEAKALIEADRRGDEMEAIVEAIRSTLSEAIADGRVVLDRWSDGENPTTHPNISILQLAPNAAVVVTDDRYMNQYPRVEQNSVTTPIWTSLDLLSELEEEGNLSRKEVWAYKTKLRQYGYALIPSDQSELEYYLSKSPVINGKLFENAELKAFRENLRLTEQRRWLVLMKENAWLFRLLTDLCEATKTQWRDDIPDEDARARSGWLLACADLRNWAGCLDGDQGNIARYGMAIAYSRLLMNRVESRSDAALARMDAWLENLMSNLKAEQPDIYDWMLAQARQAIAFHAKDIADGT